jgi:hypothetical protein
MCYADFNQGVFVSQADAMLVVATYGKIASEFHDLQAGSWLVSSYALAMCVAQPLVRSLQARSPASQHTDSF